MKHETLRDWDAPQPIDIAADFDDFLDQLVGPTWITQPGIDATRTRMLSTLLHGNEPSGLRALHAWLRSGESPAVNLACFVGAVEAARTEPRFSTRMLDGTRDLNRCFRPPFDDDAGRLAEAVLERVRRTAPECLLDLHNTSGTGPAYGVTTRLHPPHRALTALFTDHVILTDLRLGTLIEAVEDELPALVVECGGSADEAAHATARRGFFAFAREHAVLAPHGARKEEAARLDVLEHPIRVELAPGFDVAYARERVPHAAVTLRPDVDQHNFGVVPKETHIGWLGEAGLRALHALCREGQQRAGDLFRVEGDALVLRRDLRLFMITTRPEIAQSDCLFYALPAGSSNEPLDIEASA